MTAREFCKKYVDDGTTIEEILSTLDRYLVGTAIVKYREFPDADLPEEFLEAGDEPAGFEEFFSDC